MVQAVEYLVISLLLGALTTFLVVGFWLLTLRSSTVDIKNHQEANRIILEENQKIIKNNQKEILKHLDQLQAKP